MGEKRKQKCRRHSRSILFKRCPEENEEEEGKKKRKLGSDNFLPDNFKIRFEAHDAYLVFYKPILFGSSSINFVGSRPKISPVAPFHSPTRMPQSLCVSITTSPTGYAMHKSVKPSFCSSSSKVNSRSVISDWSVSPETHFATHALFIIVWKKRELYFRCVSVSTIAERERDKETKRKIYEEKNAPAYSASTGKRKLQTGI